jgi:hypothetical protein
MAAKKFQFRADARQSILRGASVLADAVRVTLGPKSKSVLIEKKFGRPIVCDDGVTIAKEVELKDPEENLGAPNGQGSSRTYRRGRRRWHYNIDASGPCHSSRGGPPVPSIRGGGSRGASKLP